VCGRVAHPKHLKILHEDKSMRVPVQAGFADYKKFICVLTGQFLDPLLPGVNIKVVIPRLQGGRVWEPEPLVWTMGALHSELLPLR
jgi:hypothetical protein